MLSLDEELNWIQGVTKGVNVHKGSPRGQCTKRVTKGSMYTRDHQPLDPTLKCQIKRVLINRGLEKIPKFNKRGVKISGKWL